VKEVRHSNSIEIMIKGQELVANKSNVVYYSADSPEAEVCEINGQKRVYETTAPNWLYNAFFLTEPMVSVEYVVTSVNISKAN
jgi:hypothetical protein